jgi:hypothetical protein
MVTPFNIKSKTEKKKVVQFNTNTDNDSNYKLTKNKTYQPFTFDN